MAIATLPQVPDQFFAGDTVKVRIENASFPAPTWTATLALNGPEAFTKAGAADGSAHLFTLASGDTANRKPGIYGWNIYVEADGERQTLLTGNLWLKPNAAVAVLSWAQECLELIRAHIKGRLPAGLASHTINGNQISKIPMPEAVKLEAHFRGLVAAEDRAKLNATGDDGSIQIAFAR